MRRFCGGLSLLRPYFDTSPVYGSVQKIRDSRKTRG